MSNGILRRIFGGPAVTHPDVPGNLVPAVVGLVPAHLLTDGGGENPRVRVDVGQTGFFAGREFRTFREFDTPFTGTFVVKVVIPVDIIVFSLGAEIDQGYLRMETVIGGTEGGSFAEALPIRSRNTMAESPQPPYQAQVQITAGGTLSGGVTQDVLRLKTDTNTNRSFSIGQLSSSERGVGAATMYLRLTATDMTGVLRGWWEERP